MKRLTIWQRVCVFVWLIAAVPCMITALFCGCATRDFGNHPVFGNPPVELFGFDLHRSRPDPNRRKPQSAIIYKSDDRTVKPSAPLIIGQ